VIQSLNMNLTQWSALGDLYSHVQLSNNFDKIDNHDHTENKGKKIPAGGLDANSVGSAQLQTNAVTQAKMADGSVGTAELRDDEVTVSKMARGIKGAASVSTSTPETTSSESWANLPTADSVSVTLVADGLIAVSYRALVQSFGDYEGAHASLFLDNGQVKLITSGGAPAAQDIIISDSEYQWLRTTTTGLSYVAASGDASDDISTGLVAPAFCLIEAPAGTHTISVRYRGDHSGGVDPVYTNARAKDRVLRAFAYKFS